MWGGVYEGDVMDSQWSMPSTAAIAMAITALLVAVMIVAHITQNTLGIYDTISAIIGSWNEHSPVHLWVWYWLWMPFTWGNPRMIHVRVPVRDAPRIRDEETANLVGQQIRDTYGMDSVETHVAHGIRYWDLYQ